VFSSCAKKIAPWMSEFFSVKTIWRLENLQADIYREGVIGAIKSNVAHTLKTRADVFNQYNQSHNAVCCKKNQWIFVEQRSTETKFWVSIRDFYYFVAVYCCDEEGIDYFNS